MSKLKEIIPYNLFKNAFEHFVEQSEKNAISGNFRIRKCVFFLRKSFNTL